MLLDEVQQQRAATAQVVKIAAQDADIRDLKQSGWKRLLVLPKLFDRLKL